MYLWLKSHTCKRSGHRALVVDHLNKCTTATMSFWNRIIGGTKNDCDGVLPTGGSHSLDQHGGKQENATPIDRKDVPKPKTTSLPPPPTKPLLAHEDSSTNRTTNQPPLQQGPPPMISGYYSPGNQKKIHATAGGPSIPGHSPIGGPTSASTPSSPIPVPGLPSGINLFNPVTSAVSCEHDTIVVNEMETDEKINETDIDSFIPTMIADNPCAPPLPDDFQNDDLFSQEKEKNPLELKTALTSESVVDKSPSAPVFEPCVKTSLHEEVQQKNVVRAQDNVSDPTEQQSFQEIDHSVSSSCHPESSQTPSPSAITSNCLVIHKPINSPSSGSGDNETGFMCTDLVLNQENETQLALITPKSTSRFVFVSDEKTVPSELKKLGEATMRRRHLFQTRVHELDCQLASLTAKLANESMDREAAMSEILPAHVYQPLEVVAERLLVDLDLMRRPRFSAPGGEKSPNDEIDKDLKASSDSSIMDLERRLSKLDSQMTSHVHKQMFEAKRERLEAVQDQLLHEIAPDLQMEASKADKREGSMNRRWESLAGILARRYLDESSTRKASLAVVEEEIVGVLHQQEADDVVVLATLRDLRARLDQERLMRLAEDKRVLDLITETAVHLQRLLLETLADPIN